MRLSAKDMNKAVVVKNDWDWFDSGGWTDSKEFEAYTKQVEKLIHAGREKVRDQKEALGDAYNVDWHQTAIDVLKSQGTIALKGNDVEPRRYIPATVRVLPKRSYESTLGPLGQTDSGALYVDLGRIRR